MRNLRMVPLLCLLACTGSALTATQKARVNTEAKQYTAKSCSGSTSSYQYKESDIASSVAMGGDLFKQAMLEKFEGELNNFAAQGGWKIVKLSEYKGGLRAYMRHQKATAGYYLAMAMDDRRYLITGCTTK